MVNVFITPRPSGQVQLIQLDDLNSEALGQFRDQTFMVLWTSGNHEFPNFQAWLATSSNEPDLVSRLKQRAGADPGATGTFRAPAGYNAKPWRRRADGTFPTIQLLVTEPGRMMDLSRLSERGLIEEPLPQIELVAEDKDCRPWIGYDLFLERAPASKKAGAPNRSRCAQAWAATMMNPALKYRHSPTAVKDAILRNCPKAKERARRGPKARESYADSIIRSAIRAIAKSVSGMPATPSDCRSTLMVETPGTVLFIRCDERKCGAQIPIGAGECPQCGQLYPLGAL